MDIFQLEKHFDLLGFTAKDKITKLEGVITALNFDLYGCIQVIIVPPAKDGEAGAGSWFDISRVEILSSESVMPLPAFERSYISAGNKGGADKPLPR